MADAGLNAIEKGILTALNVVGVTALVPAVRHYNMLVPPDGTYPAIVLSLHDNDNEGRAFGQDAGSYDYLVKGITRQGTSGAGVVEVAGDIAAAIDAALHNASLTSTGYTPYACKRQRWVRYPEYDEGRVLYVHSGAVYRIWLY